MVFMPTISTFAIAELLTMNNIKLFGTTKQENINNGMWNYGAALSLIMLFLIGITGLFSNESSDSAKRELYNFVENPVQLPSTFASVNEKIMIIKIGE